MPHTETYDYATGFKSEDAAWLALEDFYATGEVNAGERPGIRSYKAPNGKRRWAVTVTYRYD
ncbi:hypothetical protein [Roseovarius amoyensis]|uniref:hypothetical protein n=1 Tax=Roseovarius amoyensis TaxID=2211448 RepID=UPI000DBE0CB2|nr:hypothetical protein [Roseovarius amoyensis]